MKIWIDLANAPHVNFFEPLIRWFYQNHDYVELTFRDFNRTVELAHKKGLKGSLIGGHGGVHILGKAANLAERSARLSAFALGRGFDLALSHTSFAQCLSGWALNIRLVQIMDYEGQPGNHLAFRLANKVIVPRCFPDDALRRFGAYPSKVYKYDGFKEQVYLSDFEPDKAFPVKLSSSPGFPERWRFGRDILITIRTPADMALYHRFKNPLFYILLERLHRMTDVMVVLLPRTLAQQQLMEARFPNFFIPREPLDGMSLLYYSDLAVSAGGTMNREAAVLGVPAFTIFAGEIPAIDRHLIALGRLQSIALESDLDKLVFAHNTGRVRLRNAGLREEIAREILSCKDTGRLTRFFP